MVIINPTKALCSFKGLAGYIITFYLLLKIATAKGGKSIMIEYFCPL